MYLILTASKDTYITNKIIDNNFRAKDANVGKAGTLDLFKLYAESISGSNTSPKELSRALIKFDLQPLYNLTASNLDLNASNFEVKLKMYDLLGGQATPSNFNLVVYPLSKSFDEGIGRDVSSFGDLDSCNFITASYATGSTSIWAASGANSSGLLNSQDIDFITSGNLGSEIVDLGSSQNFIKGNENLEVNLTTVVSATMANVLPDHGFRISFSGSEETDNKTRFVKRFASRQSSNQLKVPQLHVSWDDSRIDHHNDFIFNVSGSLFLNNFQRGNRANLVSGSAAAAISGDDCLIIKLQKGEFTQYITASQHSAGTDSTAVAGLYSGSFAVDLHSSKKTNSKINQVLVDLFNHSGSITFDEYWMSLDESVGFYTGSLNIKPARSTSYSNQPSDLHFRFFNLAAEYSHTAVVTLKVFAEDLAIKDKVSKFPYAKKSIILSNVYYRVRDVKTQEIVIPFKTTNNATKLSSDSEGMYFEFRMEAIPADRSYVFELLVKDYGLNQMFENVSANFRVIS
ncbi:hypothetical protein CL634_08180 [bacterium]|nr:hypothetical protein [bacterium]